jgi:PPOX class probable F420-dependent enzyme
VDGALIPSPERQAWILANMPNAIVATVRRDGLPQLTPNWYLWTGGELWISTSAGTAKIHNLRRDPRIVVCIDDPDGGDYVQITGTATIVEGLDVREPTLALIRKYRDEPDVVPHWETISAASTCVLIVVRPDRFQWHDR